MTAGTKLADGSSAERLHVLAHPSQAIAAAAQVGISYIKRGTTTNFAVYYDGSLATGPTLADALLSSCEWEYSMLKSWFGGITPAGLPFNVYIDSGSFGAYHATCAATTIHCAAFSGTDADLVRMLLAAEVDEVFMAAQSKGWGCGFSHGEGLSRVLATELYPAELDGFASAATWLDGSRPNWVDTTEGTDSDYTSIGCSVLFLNFLRYELTYSWNAIVAAAAPTLAGVYQKLTSQTDGWARFSAIMQAYYPKGTPSGVTTDNPFPLTRHSGSLIQGRFGNHGNFEVVEPASAGGLGHFWRNNDVPALTWSGKTAFGASLGVCSGASVIESDFEAPGLPGNLEVAAVTSSGHLNMLWRDSGPAFNWSAPVQVATGVRGKPALIQSKFGKKGNFELVVASASGGLVHYFRNNDVAGLPWSGPTAFGASLGPVDAVALIQSNFGKPGNLEVIARVGAKLYALWRDSGPSFTWSAPVQIATNVAGQPSFIQSRFGTKENFELVVPAASGGLMHFWRNNDVPALPWSAPTAFGVGAFTDVTVIESNFGDPGNLEVLARSGNNLSHFWRDSAWHGPTAVASGI
jgi:hypothetical protein